MSGMWNIVRVAIAAVTIVVVAELSKRYPRYGALLLSLPITSILAFVFSWQQHHDMPALAKLAKETLILVPLGLPFFIPLAYAGQMGWSFWPALVGGLVLASLTIGAWLAFGS